jgi:hypothetical protein
VAGLPIHIIPENVLSPIPTAHDVVDRPGKLDWQLARHRPNAVRWHALFPTLGGMAEQVYRARNPKGSPLWRCLDAHFDTFLDIYPEANGVREVLVNYPWVLGDTRPGQPYRQPATLRSAVFLAGAVLGWSAKHMVVRLSTAWGGLQKHKPLIQRALAWTNPTSPKLAPANTSIWISPVPPRTQSSERCASRPNAGG